VALAGFRITVLPAARDERKIPGADGGHNAHRRFDNQMAFSISLMRHNAAVRAACLLGEPAQVVDGHGDFADALG
jgi:hypothetical protein